MANIFEIENKLQAVFNELEENGGELTEELAQELEITQENLKNKIDSYCQVITLYKSEDTCCKEEKQRINNIQKTKKNVIEKLKNILLNAVEQFGNDGKSGNKVIETPTHKLFTKASYKYTADEQRLQTLAHYWLDYMRELHKTGILETGDGVDFQAALDCVNQIIESAMKTPDEFGNTPVEEFIPYTLEDLRSITYNVSFGTTLYDLFTSDIYNDLSRAVLSYHGIENTELSLNKDVDAIAETYGDDKITIAQPVRNVSLTIK